MIFGLTQLHTCLYFSIQVPPDGTPMQHAASHTITAYFKKFLNTVSSAYLVNLCNLD